jgi:hypothetical protein
VPAVRQKLHLSHCADFRDRLSLYHAIRASHLNTFDVALSIQHRLGGELKREKVGWQDFTSLFAVR